MTATFIAAAAYANYRGAQHAGRPTLAAQYLAGASVFAYLMWHTILTRIRHTELRSADAIEDPLPRFRLLRWLLAFNETREAFIIAVRENLTRPREALARIHERPALPAASEIPPADDRDAVGDLVALAAERGGKRLAIEKAAQILKSHEPTRIQQWLGGHGIEIDLSYVSRTLKDQVHTINGSRSHS